MAVLLVVPLAVADKVMAWAVGIGRIARVDTSATPLAVANKTGAEVRVGDAGKAMV